MMTLPKPFSRLCMLPRMHEKMLVMELGRVFSLDPILDDSTRFNSFLELPDFELVDQKVKNYDPIRSKIFDSTQPP